MQAQPVHPNVTRPRPHRDTVGEIALIDGGTRTATVTAETDLRCHGLTAWDFRGIAESDARISWALVQALARRLREAQLDD